MENFFASISPTTIWAVLGLVLIILEAVTSGFFLLFFGISALLVAVAKLLGMDHLNGELLIFASGGILGILVFRKKMMASFMPPGQTRVDENKEIILSHAIHPHGQAHIEYQGVMWTAENPTDVDMPKGTRVLIARTESTKLILKPKL